MKRVIIKILVNMLTISRTIFSIVFLTLLFGKIPNELFLIIIAVLFYTDRIDGLLARGFKVQSSFGAANDTISDKVLSIGLIIPLLTKYKYLYFLLVAEVLIALTNFIGFIKRKDVKAEIFGKIKMWILSFAIILGYASFFGYISSMFFKVFSVFTFVVQIIVLVSYIAIIRSKKSDKNAFNIKSWHDLFYILFSTDYYLKNSKQKKVS